MNEITEVSHDLTRFRKANNLELEDVARRLGVTRATVSRYETSQRVPRQPHLDALVILSDGEVDGNSWLGKEAADVVAKRRARA